MGRAVLEFEDQRDLDFGNRPIRNESGTFADR
jgi:hypothetical protein